MVCVRRIWKDFGKEPILDNYSTNAKEIEEIKYPQKCYVTNTVQASYIRYINQQINSIK